MRILILWADDRSTNLGVRALAEGSRALALRVWPDAEFVYQNYGARHSQLPIGRLRSLAKERVTGRLGMMTWLAEFDLAIDTRSGDSFADIYGLRRLALMTAVGDLVRQSGTPIVLAPQTIGPFDSRPAVALARRSLRHATVVMSRDPGSTTVAERLGRPVDVETTDVVFALPPSSIDRQRDVVLNVSGLLWRSNPHVDYRRYREVIASICRSLNSEGRHVSLMAHVIDSPDPDNDVPAAREVQQAWLPDAEVMVPTSLAEARSVLASAQVVIGSRMHACLNALSQGVPAVPIAYSRKFAPLLSQLGWDHTVDLRADTDHAADVVALARRDSLRTDAEQVSQRARADIARAASALVMFESKVRRES